MGFDPVRAEIRFGFGLSPKAMPPASVAEMLARVKGPDHVAQELPIEPYQAFGAYLAEEQKFRKLRRQLKKQGEKLDIREALKPVRQKVRQVTAANLRQTLLRWSLTEDGFRERLVEFWASHFTAHGKVGLLRFATDAYVEGAVRPHVAGRFADMLVEAVTHPIMLHYLDQSASVGPGSAYATKRKNKVGLNENLAREILELHTLGVNGPYSQGDVRQLAELLTGLTITKDGKRQFLSDRAEPGAETVLGKAYGGAKADLADIREVLFDLARHPATAHHIATKLARHFVADNPAPELVAAIEARYLETDGDLPSIYEVLLTHPVSWATPEANIKQPVVFVGSALRALHVTGRDLDGLNPNQTRRYFTLPMMLMGQEWRRPNGPDGWPESDGHWITPQGMAARLQWALLVPGAMRRALPDPRDFVKSALAGTAPEPVKFAANAAETRREGIALILTSPAFQRH